ncbi:MAG: hypothetical protein Q4C82_03245 [Eubacteriales bacterium]|nr:hypothetical protein [Eubacteriales bacterium]
MFDFDIRPGEPDRLGATRLGKDSNFAAAVPEELSCSLLLYPKGSEEPAAELEFTEEMRFGDVCAVRLCRFPAERYEYNYRIDGQVVQDPYAVRITGGERWGACPEGEHSLRCGMDAGHFPWQGDKPLRTPYEECVLYATHVRGFTMDPSARARRPGTFAGVQEKIPHLRRLGITQLELMPVYEFPELGSRAAPKRHMPIPRGGAGRINYWGYGEACFFAPKAAYSASGDPVRELKELVRALHRNGIELILEFYFPDGTNPNLIMDCIRHWAKEYHIDGVHLNSREAPLQALAMDPALSRIKLMSEYFPVDRIYGPGREPTARRLAEYNDDFLTKARRFLRGDGDALMQAAESMRRNPASFAVINYMASHNGFPLADAVSYAVKHNGDNGEENRDGTDYNFSANYGVEGPTSVRQIRRLRSRQVRNAFLILLLSQGVPAIYGGDEMGNSQQGNNNVYCQDNGTSWIQWSRRKADRELCRFVQEAVAFRRGHPAFGRRQEYRMRDDLSRGTPDLSYHGRRAWYADFQDGSREIGVLYAGEYTEGETLYVVYNMHMSAHELALPTLPEGQSWYLKADTGREEGAFFPDGEEPLLEERKMIEVKDHTILILAGRRHETD